jgi:hypothetical protein
MNERMKELAAQAGFNLDNLPDDVFIPLQIFAELTAKECVSVMTDANQSKLRLSDAIWNTKQHFGI